MSAFFHEIELFFHFFFLIEKCYTKYKKLSKKTVVNPL